MKRSFVDSGVLIAAARGNSDRTERALDALSELEQVFLSSIFIKLEVLPKAICYKQQAESNFYDFFFGNVTDWATDLEQLTQSAYELASTYGLSGLDALNIAAAITRRGTASQRTKRRRIHYNREAYKTSISGS